MRSSGVISGSKWKSSFTSVFAEISTFESLWLLLAETAFPGNLEVWAQIVIFGVFSFKCAVLGTFSFK